ncbi:Rad2 nuclease [Ceratobasidium sp. 370]|nr:Rad2 nuclease [Ceratobasidium sp. 370]
MGIQGLLPLLRSIHSHTNISAFSGKTLAVDGYVWLHRGAYACAVQLVKGQYTTKYVDYAMHRVRMMRHHGVTPYVVFDGGPLPAKRGTESDREEKRAKSLALAQALEAQGQHGQAYEHYKKCVDITPQMAYQLIKSLRAEGVSYVVAPYEADAQLAYLEREGIVDGIVTEDSDLVIFGCKNILFKLGPDGSCVHVCRDDLAGVKDFNLYGWGNQELRWMAMLSGCDYISSMQGLGLKTAHKLLRKWKTVDRVIQAVRMEGTTKVPQSYLENFRIAELAFLHQRVYDPISQRLTHLGPPPEDEEWDESKDAFVGEDLPPEVAKMIAEGDVCPISRKAMQDIMPAFQPRPKKGKPVLKDMPSNSSVKGSVSQKSISTYFSAASISSQVKRPPTFPKIVNVKGSGRTSLSAQMTQTAVRDDDDWEVMEIAGPSQPTKRPATASRFFGTPSTPRKSRPASATTPERKRKRADSLEEISTPRASRAIVRRWSGDIVDLTEEKENKGLRAESSTGTSRSGSPDTFSLLQDLSSPIQPGSAPSRSRSPDWIATQISSPVSTRKPAARLQLHHQLLGATDSGVDLDQDLPDPAPLSSLEKSITPPRTDTVERLSVHPPAKRNTTSVDLNTVFSQESVSDIGTFEEGPWTPNDPPTLAAQIAANREGARDLDDAEYISDEEEQEAAMAERQARVAEGWTSRYGFKVVKGRKSMPAIQSTQSTTAPSATTSSASSRPIAVFQPLAMPKSRPKVKGRKSEPALTRTVIDLDDDDEEFLLGSDTVMSSPERAADRFHRLKCPA